jgi:hypothetical protein
MSERKLRQVSLSLLVLFIASAAIAGEPCTASGVYTVNGKETKLTHAYASTEENPFDESQTDTVILLADRELAPGAAGDGLALMKLASTGSLRGIKVQITNENDVISGHVYHDAFAEFDGSFSATGMHEFTREEGKAGTIGGKITSGGDSEFAGVTWGYSASFRCPTPGKEKPGAAPALAGKPLPANGGDPGKAYLAFQKALTAGDVKKLKELASKERAEQMNDPEFAEMLPMIREMQAKDIKITGGSVDGATATLLVTGTSDGSQAKGTVHLVLEGKQWKVEKESWTTGGE